MAENIAGIAEQKAGIAEQTNLASPCRTGVTEVLFALKRFSNQIFKRLRLMADLTAAEAARRRHSR